MFLVVRRADGDLGTSTTGKYVAKPSRGSSYLVQWRHLTVSVYILSTCVYCLRELFVANLLLSEIS